MDPVQAQEEQQENRDAQGNITQQYRAEIREVIGRNGIVPTPWEEGIEKIKAAIGKYSNQVMARYKFMFKMPRPTTRTGASGDSSCWNRQNAASGRTTLRRVQLWTLCCSNVQTNNGRKRSWRAPWTSRSA